MTIIITTNPPLHGVGATSSAGHFAAIGFGRDVLLVGVETTSTEGLLTPAFGLAGLESTSQVGIFRVDLHPNLFIGGLAVVAAVGSMRRQADWSLIGVEAETGFGVAAYVDPQPMHGLQAVTQVGVFPMEHPILLIGRQATARVGVLGFHYSFGQQAVSHVGSLTPQVGVMMVGVSGVTIGGQLFASPRNVTTVGVDSTSQVGSFGVEIFF